MCDGGIELFEVGEVVPPLFLQGHHLCRIGRACQLNGPAEGTSCSVSLHGLLEIARLLVEIPCLLIEASINQGRRYLLEEVMLGA